MSTCSTKIRAEYSRLLKAVNKDKLCSSGEHDMPFVTVSWCRMVSDKMKSGDAGGGLEQ